MPDDITGQTLDTQISTDTGAGNTGDTGKAGTTLPDKSGDIKSDPGADKKVEVPDFIEQSGVKYYKGFDKHPEWRELKDAKTSLQTILDEHGYRSLDELHDDFRAGQSLAELLGSTDANQVQAILDKAQKWDAAEEYWAEKKAKELEKGETQEETIARLKKERKELEDARRKDAEKFTHTDDARRQLENFNRDVGEIVDAASELTDAEKSVLKLHLGVDNPMDEVNIGDRKAVRSTAQNVISQFTEFVKAVRQNAVDEYTKGQSKIVPTPPAGGGEPPNPAIAGEKKIDVTKYGTMEDAFDAANKLVLELAKGAEGV